MKRKIDETNFFKIKNFTHTHTIIETAREFGVCAASVSQCKRFNTVEEYREHYMKKQRQNYLARKSKIKLGNGIHFESPKKPIDGTGGQTVNGDPFGDAIKPQPITPVGAQKTPAQDSPITIRKAEEEPKILPMTHEQYREAYKRQEIEIGTLKGKLAKAEMDLKKKTEDHDALKTLYDNLFEAYRRKSEALDKMTQPIKPLGNVVSMTEVTDISTEIEITVGDAVIKVSTKGK